jgi:hypothetical protein
MFMSDFMRSVTLIIAMITVVLLGIKTASWITTWWKKKRRRDGNSRSV